MLLASQVGNTFGSGYGMGSSNYGSGFDGKSYLQFRTNSPMTFVHPKARANFFYQISP
jgi:hypothetical protein